jgi:phosphoglycolate phosphatase-like HAD superfamily hydrolase
MGKNGFIEGLWNGMKVEFGKVYSNLNALAFTPLHEAENPKGKKLRVFDFDDTLVKTHSHIYITHGDGKKSKLTPGEYAIYEPKADDVFDFSDFQKVTQPQEIKGVTKLLKTVSNAEGERTVCILTARSAYKPVKDYLKDIGLDGIYVAALGSSDPQHKADWIEDKIKKGYDDVFFIDDSHKNVEAVKKLKEKYPNIKMKVQHVKHDVPPAPPSKKVDMKKDKEVTQPAKLKGNDMSLKSLLPKDLDKKIKNPETGKMIKIKSALQYDKSSKAHKAAEFALQKK